MLRLQISKNDFIEGKTYRSVRDQLTKNYNIDEIYKEIYNDERKCHWCGKDIKYKIKLKKQHDNKLILENEYKFYACKSNGCTSRNLNPRTYEWLQYAHGMTEEEAREFSSEIGKRSAKKRLSGQKKLSNPYSLQHWIDKGYSQEEAQFQLNSQNRRKKEFWLKKGYTEDRAKNMAKFHCRTFSLEFLMYFKGYSQEEALQKIKDHKQLISDKNKNNIKVTNTLRKGSKSADDFFKRLYKDIFSKFDITEEEIYTESFGKETEFFLRDENGIYFYDFCIPSLNLIIEYHGIHVHPKQEIQENWSHAYSKEDSKTIFKKDLKKEKLAEENGFNVYLTYYSDEDYDKFYEQTMKTVGKELEKF